MKYGLLISFVAFLWAGSFIAIKIAVEEINPITLAFLRFAVASSFKEKDKSKEKGFA